MTGLSGERSGERTGGTPEARPPSGAGTWSPPELKPENERLLADLAYVLGWLLKGDGSVGDYVIYIHGAEGHREALEYARQLCKRLGMRVGEIEPYGEGPGRTATICDRVAVREQRQLRFSINAKDFLRVVRFNHSERDRKLKSMVRGRRWTPWPEEVRERALKLHEEGLGYKYIAEVLGVPPSTVYCWLKGARTWRECEAQRRRLSLLSFCRLSSQRCPSPRAHLRNVV